jgi:hypothetical protein
VSSELSVDAEVDGKKMFFPLMVPTLTPDEVRWLLSNKPDPKNIPRPIMDKAIAFARQRTAQGRSPFAGPGEGAVPFTIPPPKDKWYQSTESQDPVPEAWTRSTALTAPEIRTQLDRTLDAAEAAKDPAEKRRLAQRAGQLSAALKSATTFRPPLADPMAGGAGPEMTVTDYDPLPKWDQLVLSRARSKGEYVAVLEQNHPGAKIVPDEHGAYLEEKSGKRYRIGVGGEARMAGGFLPGGAMTAGSIFGGVATKLINPEAGAIALLGGSLAGGAVAATIEQAAENVGLRPLGIRRTPEQAKAATQAAAATAVASELTGRVAGFAGRAVLGGTRFGRAITGGGEVPGGIPLPLPRRAIEKVKWLWEQFAGTTGDLARAGEEMVKQGVRPTARLLVPGLTKLARLEVLKEALIGISPAERASREEALIKMADALTAQRGLVPAGGLVGQVHADLLQPKDALNVTDTGELIGHTAAMFRPGVLTPRPPIPGPPEATVQMGGAGRALGEARPFGQRPAAKITAQREVSGRAGLRGVPLPPKGEPVVRPPPKAPPQPVAYDPLGERNVIGTSAYVMDRLRRMEPVQRVKWLLDLDPSAGLPETWRLERYVEAVGRDHASVKALGDVVYRQVMRGAVAATVGSAEDRLLSPRMLGMRLQTFGGNVQMEMAKFTARQKELLWVPGFENDIRTFGDMIAYVFPRAMDRGMAGWRVGEIQDMTIKARYWELAKLYLADMTILSPRMITLLARGFRQPATRGQALNALRSVVTFATHQAISAVAGDSDPSTWEETLGEDAVQPRENEVPQEPRAAAR